MYLCCGILSTTNKKDLNNKTTESMMIQYLVVFLYLK